MLDALRTTVSARSDAVLGGKRHRTYPPAAMLIACYVKVSRLTSVPKTHSAMLARARSSQLGADAPIRPPAQGST